MIEDAERRGLLKQGGAIVENTTGNTGASLAMIGAAKGYRVILTVPDKASREKLSALRAFGAEVIVAPSDVPAEDSRSYHSIARRLVREIPNSFHPNQYDNQLNARAHYHSTAPELWKQMKEKIDYLIAGIGTGGTLSGVSKYLKEHKPEVRAIAVDPEGSIFYNHFYKHKFSKASNYKIEGIGGSKMCKALDWSYIDDVVQVSDRQAFRMARRLAREQGIFAGGSSGAAVHAALELAKELDEPKSIAVILPDSGLKYASTIYNDEWMRTHNFL
mgnify:CR=1 FL=1